MLHRHQSRMLDQPIANQKNVLLTFQKLQKWKKVDQKLVARPRGTWTIEALEETIKMIEAGSCSLQKAFRSWSVPWNILYDHLNGWMHNMKMGPGGVLIDGEDANVVAWVLAMQEVSMFINVH